MSVISKYNDSIVLDANFSKNSFLDHTGLHTLTANNNPLWINSDGRKALSFNGINQYVSVADADDLSFGNGAVDVPFTFAVHGYRIESSLLMTKGVIGVDGEYSFSLTGTDELFLATVDNSEALCYIGRSSSIGLTAYKRFIAIGTSDGSGTSAGFKIYINGEKRDDANFENNPGNYVAMENLSGEVRLGRYDTSYSKGHVYRQLMLRNKELTGDEAFELFRELDKERSTIELSRRTFIFRTPKEKTNDGLVTHYDGRTLTGDGKLADLSGNGNHGTLSGAIAFEEGLFDGSLKFNGVDSLVSGGTSILSGDGTISCWFTMNDSVNADYIINYYLNSSDAWGVYYFTTDGGKIYLFDDIDNAGSALYATNIYPNKRHHLVITQEGLENKMYIDSQLVGSGISSSGNLGSFAGTLYIGGRTIGSQIGKSNVENVKVFTDAKGQDWIDNEYLQGAIVPNFIHSLDDVPPTLINVTDGKIGETDFTAFSGACSITEDSEKRKWMEAAAGSTHANLTLRSPYGTYIYRVNRGSGNVFYYPLTDTPSEISSNINAYRFAITSAGDFRIQKVTSGVGISTLVQSPTGVFSADTDYEIAVTRRYDGLFAGYFRLLGANAWATIPKNGGGDLTVTDNSFKDGVAQMLQLDNGVKIGGFVNYKGVITLN